MNSPSVGHVIHWRSAAKVGLAVLVIGWTQVATAQPSAEPPQGPATASTLLSLPPGKGPLEVRTSFELLSISRIEDEAERITFSGVLTLEWQDPRQAFDPVAEGASERVFSGAYQFNEISPSWYPQVTLANASGQFDSKAVILRVKPDGSSVLRQELEAVAKVSFDMRRFPFDRQQARAVFVLFGFDAGEVVLKTEPYSAVVDGAWSDVPQWTLGKVAASTRTMDIAHSQGSAPPRRSSCRWTSTVSRCLCSDWWWCP